MISKENFAGKAKKGKIYEKFLRNIQKNQSEKYDFRVLPNCL